MKPIRRHGFPLADRSSSQKDPEMPKLSHAVSIHPYFQIREGNLDAFLALMPLFVEKTATEPACLYYDFMRHGSIASCREAYVGAEGVFAHLENVGELLGKFLELADLIRLEIHGPMEEIDKLREPLAHLNPDFYVWETGLEIPSEAN
jgi:quinol monooxygenase YgiN